MLREGSPLLFPHSTSSPRAPSHLNLQIRSRRWFSAATTRRFLGLTRSGAPDAGVLPSLPLPVRRLRGRLQLDLALDLRLGGTTPSASSAQPIRRWRMAPCHRGRDKNGQRGAGAARARSMRWHHGGCMLWHTWTEEDAMLLLNSAAYAHNNKVTCIISLLLLVLQCLGAWCGHFVEHS